MSLDDFTLRQRTLREWYRDGVTRAWQMKTRRTLVAMAGSFASDDMKRHADDYPRVHRLLHQGYTKLIDFDFGVHWEDPLLLPEEWRNVYERLHELGRPPPARNLVDRAIVQASIQWTAWKLRKCHTSEETESACPLPPFEEGPKK